ncbi:MAG: LptF/LptG family permease [Bacteroidales bacterium]|nr:LptF/LptG family permease [Bacteroidales bacterium]MBP5518207.1 LptF/LptG family permease [Bacteroidales bacterium]
MFKLSLEKIKQEIRDFKPQITTMDKYIIKKFIGTYVVALLLIIGIVIIFDLSEKVDKFVTNQAPLKLIIFQYYANFIPYFINMFSPMFVFLTVIFFTSKMAANTEIIAILAGGISFKRLMWPYFISATAIVIFSLILNLYVIPPCNKGRLAFEQKYVRKKYTEFSRNVHYQINPGTFLYVQSFAPSNNTAYGFALESIEGHDIVSKLSSTEAQWDSTAQCWKLRDYILRTFEDGAESVKTGRSLDTAIAVTVEDFYRRRNTVQTLPDGQLRRLIRDQKVRGDKDVMFSLIEQNERWAMPFAAFILTLIGVSLSSVKRRGGIGLNIGIGIALSFSYILFMRFAQMFVYSNTLPPFIALWLPNVLYLIIAIYLYRIAPK